MSTLTHRGGHTDASPGAVGELDEHKEVMKLDTRVAELLAEIGNTMINCNPPQDYVYPSELNSGIYYSNSVPNVDMFYSIHMNSSNNKDANGCEIWTYPNTPLTEEVGKKICSNLEALGFYNRGIKQSTELSELCSVKTSSMIVETCFVSSKHDAELYRKVGLEAVARAIANGIDSRIPLEGQKEEEKKVMIRGIVVYKNDAEMPLAMHLARKLGYVAMWSGVQFDYSVLPQENIWAVGGDKGTYTGYLLDNHFISGVNRDETVKAFARVLDTL